MTDIIQKKKIERKSKHEERAETHKCWSGLNYNPLECYFSIMSNNIVFSSFEHTWMFGVKKN